MIRKFVLILALQAYLIIIGIGGLAFAGWLFLERY